MNLIESMERVGGSYVDSGETMELCDYGTVQGGDRTDDIKKGLKRAFLYNLTKSSTSGHRAEEYNIVVLTDRQIKFIPAKIGSMGGSWKPGEPVLSFLREQVKLDVGEVKTGKGMWKQQSVQVQFLLPDGTSRVLELYNSPRDWRSVAEAAL